MTLGWIPVAVATAPAAVGQVAPDSLVLSSLGALLVDVQAANPSLRAMRVGADALATRADQAGAWPDPMVGMAWQPVPIVTARGSQRTQWQVQQTIPYPGKLALRASAADWTSEAAYAEANTMELNLLESARHSWIDLARILGQEALVREFSRALRSFEEVAHTRYQVGQGSQQAILKAQLERNALSNRLLELGAAKRSLVERLADLVNRPVALRDSVLGTESVAGPLPAASPLETATELRPELRVLGALSKAADARIELAHKEWWPDLGLQVTWFDIAPRDMPPTADGTNGLAVGISVRLPLQRGRLRSQLEETELMRSQLDARVEAVVSSIRTQIADLTYRIRSTQEQLDLLSDALIPQAETTLAATLSSYTTGKASFLDLLDAERMLFDLRWSFETTRATHLKAEASMLRALGVDGVPDRDS